MAQLLFRTWAKTYPQGSIDHQVAREWPRETRQPDTYKKNLLSFVDFGTGSSIEEQPARAS